MQHQSVTAGKHQSVTAGKQQDIRWLYHNEDLAGGMRCLALQGTHICIYKEKR